jgi:WD40 repeat protein
MMIRVILKGWLALSGLALIGLACIADDAKPNADSLSPKDGVPAAKKSISFDKQIRPILQANCIGCHQPAKDKGGLVLTDFAKMLEGGDSGDPAIVPKHPERSLLIEQITPMEGKAAMPPYGRAPLAESDIDLIKRWVAEGAVNDSVHQISTYTAEHPPVYTRPPVITSLDYSPDSKWLAVAGFHEVLLFNAETLKLEGRLIGLAERIQSVKFSPNSEYLAVAGGLPARQGEIQIWNVADKKLSLSAPFAYDTLYGVSWSPDGSKVAFGCPDNTVRAIDAKTGQQVLQQGSHSDWPLATAFNPSGTHVVSVSRDMTAKLTEVATQRFVDNITSITPGALRGGINSVVMHPSRDEIVMGGSDGKPKVYRIFRNVERKIGDDSNLIRELPALPGRVNSVAVSKDAKHIAAVSSLDMAGTLQIYSYDFDPKLPDELRKIMAKEVTNRSAEEKKKIEQFHNDNVKLIAKATLDHCALFGVAFHPNGQTLAAAGADGQIHLYEANTCKLIKSIPVAPKVEAQKPSAVVAAERPQEPVARQEPTTPGTQLIALEVSPPAILLNGPFDYVQMVVLGKVRHPDGSLDTIDVTRQIQFHQSDKTIAIEPTGLVRPLANGGSRLHYSLGNIHSSISVEVTGYQSEPSVDYVHDVMPIISKIGCNAGTCHGAQAGKGGFKLSLRGYDPIFDVRAFTDELASRRTNLASPEDSLMLLKPSAAVPHVGGQVIRPGEAHYEILKRWIAMGATLKSDSPRVVKIDIQPKNPIIEREGSKQQFRVEATYANGSKRDVTQETILESGNTEVATHNKAGLLTAVRRGEAPILARFEGNYTATTLTVMGDRSGFAWEQPASYGRIDDLVAAKWKRMKIKPSELATDIEFIRRIYLDLTGMPPSSEAIQSFLADKRESKIKREALIDQLIGTPEFIDYWTNKWADLLQVNRKFLGPEGAAAFRAWIRGEVEKNTPYDQFVRKVITAKGSNKENPPASYFKILREPTAMMENTTHLFLGVRFNCNKCHDHPFERWTQDNYYQTASFFARTGLKPDPASGARKIGGTDVEGAKPFYEFVEDTPSGEVQHLRTGQLMQPKFPYQAKVENGEKKEVKDGQEKIKASFSPVLLFSVPSCPIGFVSPSLFVSSHHSNTRREQLADWLTSKDNQYFARSYVNRIWGYLFGVGLIEPLDDIRAGNPPSNPELLDYLTQEFIKSNFNVRQLMAMIAKSRTYQLSVKTNQWNADDKHNFSHATAKRLAAEVLYDTVYRVTGAVTKIPGVPPGTRAAALPDSGVELPTGFLAALGRPVRESACECERSSGLQLGPVMALVNGQTIADAINDPDNALGKLVASQPDNGKLIAELFLRILGRPATAKEIAESIQAFQEVDVDHKALLKELAEREKWWVPVIAKKEEERKAAIAKTKTELEAHEKAIAPKAAELEKQRQEKIKQLEAELKKYESTILATKLGEYERSKKDQVDWFRFNPTSFSATNGSKLAKQDDLSLFASGELKKSDYTVTATSDVKGITALRLEVLMDDKLPNTGPGRAPNGNFVLSEFEVSVAPKNDPKQGKKLKLASAKADFSQQNYSADQLIDGNANDQKGWAVVPNTGITHWVVFQLKEPVGFDGGTTFTFKLLHRFNLIDHTIGRFRISASTTNKPTVPVGLADEFRSILDLPEKEQTDKHKDLLLKYYRSTDAELQKRQESLAQAKMPLPIDPRLQELRSAFAEVSKPVPLDPKLAQLRQDAETSKQQIANPRLTAAQDLAWALINSPAFLFNH